MVTLRNSIATYLFKVIFGLYLVVTIIVTITQMVFEYEHVTRAVRNEISQLPVTYIPGLGAALWTLQYTLFLFDGTLHAADDGSRTFNLDPARLSMTLRAVVYSGTLRRIMHTVDGKPAMRLMRYPASWDESRCSAACGPPIE